LSARLPAAMIAFSEQVRDVLYPEVAAGMMGLANTGLVGCLSWVWSMLLIEVGSLGENTGLVARMDLASTAVVVDGAVGTSLASTVAGVDFDRAGRHHMELGSSLLEPERPVGGLRNTRRILPGVVHQGVDY